MTEVDSSTENCSIRTEHVEACPLCGGPAEEFYRQAQEYIFGIRGLWGYQRCGSCDLFWLTPRAIQEDIAKIYPEVHFKSLDSGHDWFFPAPSAGWISGQFKLFRISRDGQGSGTAPCWGISGIDAVVA